MKSYYWRSVLRKPKECPQQWLSNKDWEPARGLVNRYSLSYCHHTNTRSRIKRLQPMHVSAQQRLRWKETKGKNKNMLSLSSTRNTGVLHTEERVWLCKYLSWLYHFLLYVFIYMFIFTSVYVCEQVSTQFKHLSRFIYTERVHLSTEYRQGRRTYQNNKKLWKEVDDLLSSSRPWR